MESQPWNQGMTVMLVEEDASMRRRMRRDLEEEGFHVLTALTSVEALVMAADYPFPVDLLITDTRKRVYQNGMELAACFRVLRPETAIILRSEDRSGFQPAAPGGLPEMFARVEPPYSKARLMDAVGRTLLGWNAAQAA